MMQIIKETISSVGIGAPKTFRNLSVFPILRVAAGRPDYLILDEALAQHCAHITEVSEEGRVPQLTFVNESDKRIFLLDGEELIGAKQDRILNLSILIAAGKTVVIPVSCVERGRWSQRSRQFSSSARMYYAQGRAMKMHQVTSSMKLSGLRSSDQGAVWRDIDRKFSRMGTSSSSSAMGAVYEEYSTRLEDFAGALSATEGQVGAMFAIDGQIIGFDLFDSPETLQKLLPKLVRGYALDALDSPGSQPPATARHVTVSQTEAVEFLTAVNSSEANSFPGVGEGQDVRLTSPNLSGAALISDNRVIHLTAFRLRNE